MSENAASPSPVQHEHRLVQSRNKNVQAQVHGGGAVGRFNSWLAIKATAVLGNMWFFWFCVLLDLFSLPSVFQGQISLGTYLSSVVIQLLALPLLGAGQRIISAAQDARAEADHETLLVLHRLSQQQLEILNGQNEVLDLLRKTVVKS